MGWIQDLIDPKARDWEEFYRGRVQFDSVVRSSHGVNCTGGCSWNVYVKEGLVAWEMQAVDYPMLAPNLPPYEPRGCQRGISASWYVYSPLRVKYPYVRGALLGLWRDARDQFADPVAAWAHIVEDPQRRARYQQARGKGGFVRAQWDDVLELIAASCLYTAGKWGPDRVVGFSPIPAMSYFSYAGGSRFLQLFGGVNMSFYDWYCDLPNAFPEVWGDQTDVCESADWYNAKYVVSMGANLGMTRTPDMHFISEARHEGAKFVVLAPDFSQAAKHSDWWIPLQAGQDAPLWLAVDHVIMQEYHANRKVPYFADYVQRYTDSPFLVEITTTEGVRRAGQLLRANRLAAYEGIEHGDWKLLVWDSISGGPRSPLGTVGHRWSATKGKWNLDLADGEDGTVIAPEVTFIDQHDAVVQVAFDDFAADGVRTRGVPVRLVETPTGPVAVATVFDLLAAQLGVGRGLPGDYPQSYDELGPYTPAWQEQYTGIGRETVIRLAREFASNAEVTQGRSMIIIGAGVNQWYHNNLNYRAPITALLLCGCCGVNGGGLNHYVGQEKLAPIAPWASIAFALDWGIAPRRQQTPIWHYVNSDQWRYEGDFDEYASVPKGARWAHGHAVDRVAQSVRMGWMPFYPQFDRSPTELARQAEAAGAKTDAEIAAWVAGELKAGRLKFAVENPDAPENWPRVWFIWRANAITSSAKGHEFFLRHYLGTHDNIIADEVASADSVRELPLDGPAPRGKMDLIVDLNFRMDTSALYSDIVLPAAMWYEKNDLNSTDLHSFMHPLGAAVPPAWESRSDWDIFKQLAEVVSDLAPDYFPEPVRDIVTLPLAHDTPDELAQPTVRDWKLGECEPIPGKTMPHVRVVRRDYANLYNQFISFGRRSREAGVAANGVQIPIRTQYDALLTAPTGGSPDPRRTRCVEWGGIVYPSLEDTLDAANVLLAVAPETNGEVAYAAFAHEQERVGRQLVDLAEETRHVEMTFAELATQPKRVLTSPVWSGIVNRGRAYAAWCINVEKLVPWRTLTGRQQLYLDHPYYLDFGEGLPTYKPRVDAGLRDVVASATGADSLVLNYITPHGKWHIHSTYYDNLRMLTLARGLEPCWINDRDAARIGIVDNDWVEIHNDNGVMVTRAAVSSRVQAGTCMVYHAPERTISVPKSQVRGGRRAGAHNSLTRTRVNPVQLAGGYAQFTYGFNYWGPVGVNRDTRVVVQKLSRLEW